MAIGGILVILAGIFFFYIRPRRLRDENNNQGGYGYYRNKEQKAELTATTPSNPGELHPNALGELHSTALTELVNTPVRRADPPIELEGTRPPRLGRFEEDL